MRHKFNENGEGDASSGASNSSLWNLWPAGKSLPFNIISQEIASHIHTKHTFSNLLSTFRYVEQFSADNTNKLQMCDNDDIVA